MSDHLKSKFRLNQAVSVVHKIDGKYRATHGCVIFHSLVDRNIRKVTHFEAYEVTSLPRGVVGMVNVRDIFEAEADAEREAAARNRLIGAA